MIRMIENSPTRRKVVMGIAAASGFTSRANADSGTSSVPWMSALEMAGLIRAKKLSAREALAAHLKQIERVNHRSTPS
jgi:amidase